MAEITLTSTVQPSPARAQGRRLDPRFYQIAVLASLLAYGKAALHFDLGPAQIAVLLLSALGVQWLAGRFLAGLPFEPKSALISALSLCLLLRTDSPAIAALAAAIAIGSKFVLRIRGKHLFNPTNLALVAVVLLSDSAWVSSGQWGSVAFFAFLMACLGGLVVHRAARSDVTYAFLAFHAAILFGRALRLGDPLTIPLHQLQNGALLLFAFFMISDPKTTPDSRAGRVVFAALVALGAWYVQFKLFRPNGLLYSLAATSLAVPLLDRLLPGERYAWARPTAGSRSGGSLSMRKETLMQRLAALVLVALLGAAPAHAFCGFFVARGDAKLFNRASQVALVRDGDRTVLTMANDFRGDLDEFAVVIPVPTFLEREQIHVADKALLDHLDAYSAPRLVEYFDENPCAAKLYDRQMGGVAGGAMAPMAKRERAGSLGVTIEASYTVGEYDILILSARESQGLTTWLEENGYRLPPGAEPVLGSYLKQGMRFFVAKVNLREQRNLGFNYLRPLQVAYESPKFMLPIRLGMVNADGPQELFVYALTRKGRVETTNYRTVRLPSDAELPVFVKEDFGRFYKDAFTRQVERENREAVFLEYAWDMAWCDPCAADPLSRQELSELGVFWLGEEDPRRLGPSGGAPTRMMPAVDVFLTRLHLRYDNAHFPADLVFQQTGDRENFQGRFVLRHPWEGRDRCPEAEQYRRELPRRFEEEAKNLAALTGWDIDEIRRKMRLGNGVTPASDEPWWKKIWD